MIKNEKDEYYCIHLHRAEKLVIDLKMEVKLTNFLCHESKTLRFDREMTLLNGRSGTGKSSVLMAIAFAINGVGTGTRLVRKGASSCKVELTLSTRQGAINIVRTKKSDSLTVLFPYGSQAEKRYIDAAAQSVINTIIPNFSYAGYLPQKGVGSFLSATPAKKKEFLNSLIFTDNLDINENKTRYTDQHVKTLRKESGFLTGAINQLSQNPRPMPEKCVCEGLEQDAETLEEFEKMLSNYESEYTHNLNEIRTVEKLIGENSANRERVKFAEERLQQLEEELESATMELESCRNRYATNEFGIVAGDAAFDPDSVEIEYQRLKTEQKRLKVEYKSIQTHLENLYRVLRNLEEVHSIKHNDIKHYNDWMLSMNGQRYDLKHHSVPKEDEYATLRDVLDRLWDRSAERDPITGVLNRDPKDENLPELCAALSKCEKEFKQKISVLCQQINTAKIEAENAEKLGALQQKLSGLEECSTETILLEIEEIKNTIREAKDGLKVLVCPDCNSFLSLESGSTLQRSSATKKYTQSDVNRLNETLSSLNEKLKHATKIEKKRTKYQAQIEAIGEITPNSYNVSELEKEVSLINKVIARYESTSKVLAEMELRTTRMGKSDWKEHFTAKNRELAEKLKELLKTRHEPMPETQELFNSEGMIDLKAFDVFYKEYYGNYRLMYDENTEYFKTVDVKYENQKSELDRFKHLQEKIESLHKKTVKQKDKLDALLLEKSVDESALKTRCEKLAERNAEIQELIPTLKRHIRALIDYERCIEEHKKWSEQLETAQSKFNELSEQLKIAERFLELLSQAESIAINRLLTEINNKLNAYLQYFFDECEISAQIAIIDKKNARSSLEVEIMLRGVPYSLDFLSGGERDRIELAFLLTMNDICELPFIMLDESLSSLDTTSVENIMLNLGAGKNGRAIANGEEVGQKLDKILIFVAHQQTVGVFDRVIDF